MARTRRVSGTFSLVWSVVCSAPVAAQLPAEKVVTFCTGDRLGDVPCADASFEVTFDGESRSVHELADYTGPTPIDTTVVLEVSTSDVQGWSYGVTHDSRYLQLDSVTIDRTASVAAREGGFFVADQTNILTCEGEPGPGCRNPQPGSGYISAIILSLTQPVTLPQGRNSVCRARYTLTADPGRAGTLIRPTNRLAKSGSPPTEFNVTGSGTSRYPRTLVTGWVKRQGEVPFDPGERQRTYCRGDGDATRQCGDEPLEIVFDEDSQSTREIETFTPGERLDTAVIYRPESTFVQGWSFGVLHDANFLKLEDVTVQGTAAALAQATGFVVASKENLVFCPSTQLVAACSDGVPTEGYITGVVLSFMDPVTLPPGPNLLVRASYSLRANPGPNGTLIRFTDHLANINGPPVQILVTVGGRSVAPRTLVDGWVKEVGVPTLEVCGNKIDDDGDGFVDCADPDCLGLEPCLPVPEICNNAWDDDQDGSTDCDDADCILTENCRPPPEVCDNGLDDDRDGRIDCDDRDCKNFPRCLRESCTNGLDDNQDGAVDCADEDCKDAIICRPEICDNGFDDNANAMTDCYDPECKDFPACEPKPEVCDNALDDDFDGKTDCADPDCKNAGPCVPKPEICDNRIDDDLDGRTDCRDRDCADAPACAPGPEVCDDCFDNDRDGLMDCRDPDCFQHPHCSPQPEICDNRLDDDDDGKVDLDDPDCVVAALSPEAACPDYALYLGAEPTTDDQAADAGGFVVSMRNRSPVLGFRLTVVSRDLGDRTLHELRAARGAESGLPGLSVVNDLGSIQLPATPNTLVGPAGEAILGVERGAALEPLVGHDFLHVEVEETQPGESRVTATYTVDMNVLRPHGVLLPTAGADPCRANELLRVLTGPNAPRFRRGEVDGTGSLGINDAVVTLKYLVAGDRPTVDCRDALDVDDDGAIGITDPIVVLRYLFQGGSALAAPFPGCGSDPTPEPVDLGCTEPSCR